MKKVLTIGQEVIAIIDNEKVNGTVDTIKGIMIVVETEEGELVNVHHSKVKAAPREVCKRLNFESRSAKLTDEMVATIRSLWGTMSRKSIADMFDISPSYAYKIADGRAAQAVRAGL